LKKKPTQQRYRKKLKLLQLKKTAIVAATLAAASKLYKIRGIKSKRNRDRGVSCPKNLGSTVKLN